MADPIASQPYVLPPEAWLANPEPAVADDAGEDSGFYTVPSKKKKPAPAPTGTPPAVATPEPTSGFYTDPSTKKPQSLPGTYGPGVPAAMAGTLITQGLDLAQQAANFGFNVQGLYFLQTPTPQFQGGDTDSKAYEGKTYTQKVWDDYLRFSNAGLGVILFLVPVNRGQQADTGGDLTEILHPVYLLGIPFDPQIVFGTDFHNDLGERLLSAENDPMKGLITNDRMLGLMGKYLGSHDNWVDLLLLGFVFTMANGQSADAGTDANYLAHHPDAGFVQPYYDGVLESRFPDISDEDKAAILEALGNDDPTVLAGYVERWEADNDQEIDDETLQAIILALDDEKIHLSVFPTLFMLSKLREASGQLMTTANSGLAAQDLARLDGKFNLPLSLSMAVGSMVTSQTPNLIDAAVADAPFELNPTALAVSGASQVLGAAEAELADGDRHLLIALGRANNLAIRSYYDPKYYAYSGQFISAGGNNNLMNSLFGLPLVADGLSNLSTGFLMGDHLQQAVEDKDWREAMPFALATSALIAYDVHSFILSQPKQSAVDAVKDNDLDIEIHGNENLLMPAVTMSLAYGGGVVMGYLGWNDVINDWLSRTLFGAKKTNPVTGAYLPGKKGITDFSISPTGPNGTAGVTLGFKF